MRGKMKIVAFTGLPGSGKSEAVRIAKEKGLLVIRMGDAVWEETKRQGLELNDKNVGEVANSMREKLGMDIWAKRTLEKIKSFKKDYIVIDGIRNIEEINLFKKELSNDFIVIAIDASDETRKKRTLSRRRKDDVNNLKSFKERDKRELRWGLGAVIASADTIISNEGSIDEFRDKIGKILDKI
jgi:dephospho-CoA kinase